jgi:hypothetical protein
MYKWNIIKKDKYKYIYVYQWNIWIDHDFFLLKD